MYFEPYGPFDLRPTLRSHRRTWRSDFWEVVERKCEGLSKANGVYIFSLKYGEKFTPWYVGKTCTDKGFVGEVFQDHKIDHFFAATERRKGREHLHLIARVEDRRGKFCGWSGRSEAQIERVETYLIGMALARNPSLRNNKKTKFFNALDIAGVIGPKYSGRPREDARSLKNLLGIALP